MAKKKLIVVGDRVLVLPEEGEERTNAGLFLPKSAIDSHAVQGGKVVSCGPGIPMGDPGDNEDEPWKQSGRQPRYFPMQARVGDYVLFFRRAAVEIKFEEKPYLVVPHQAIVALVRDEQASSESGEWPRLES
ncbi:MAG TPA: co-chaperone GroES family protein [Planctomycetota bacterium]|nr:co-chaperone GroES family protein [Planctomycetota bacterium]